MGIYQEISNGMLGFRQAMAIKVTPFPFPFAQIVQAALLVYNITLPLCIDRYVPNFFWAAAFLFCAEVVAFGLAEVATELEQPFGDDYNDLPIIQYHICFDLALRSLVDRVSFEAPCPNVAVMQRLKDRSAATKGPLQKMVLPGEPRASWYSRPMDDPTSTTENFMTTADILSPGGNA